MFEKWQFIGGGEAEWSTCQTSNLRIASRMGSNPISDKPLFFFSKKLYTHFAQYWLVPWTDFYKLTAFYTIKLK